MIRFFPVDIHLNKKILWIYPMHPLSQKLVYFIVSFFLLLPLILFTTKSAISLTNHVVISEVQVAGVTDADDEFVELYNPTEADINLSGWSLTKKISNGTETNLDSSLSGTIPSHSYY